MDFSRHWENFVISFELEKGFNVMQHSTLSDDYLWYLVLHEKAKKKKKADRQND